MKHANFSWGLFILLVACTGQVNSSETHEPADIHADSISEYAPSTSLHAQEEHPAEAGIPVEFIPSAAAWTMFRANEQHTGLIEGVGNIDPELGPVLRWTYEVVPPSSGADLRWFSTFPLGDLDGDGTLEIVVTSPDNNFGSPSRVIVLKDFPGESPPVREMWTYGLEDPNAGIDQYGPALVDADGDGLLDIVFSSRDGFVRALKGNTGQLLWQYSTGRIMESGPMISDLDGNGSFEVIQAADCLINGCPPGGAVFVFAANPDSNLLENQPLWQQEFPWKADSGEPAIADLDPNDGNNRKAIVMTSWGGQLIVLWQNASGEIIQNEFDLRALDPGIPHGSDSVVIRSSPLLADFGEGITAVFGWMPDWKNYTRAWFSAINIRADMVNGEVEFTPLWNEPDTAWKSSPGLIAREGDTPLVVSGYGYAITSSGGFGCDQITGGLVAREGLTGELMWNYELPEGQGDVRGSVAIADIDGDESLEVIGVVGCGGDMVGLDALTGKLEWTFPLGELTFVSPSVADLDGDGFLEILVASYDGKVYALAGNLP